MNLFTQKRAKEYRDPMHDFNIDELDNYIEKDFYKLLCWIDGKWLQDAEYVCVCVRSILMEKLEHVSFKNYVHYRNANRNLMKDRLLLTDLIDDESKSILWDLYYRQVSSQLEAIGTLVKLALNFKARTMDQFEKRLNRWICYSFEEILDSVLLCAKGMRNKLIHKYMDKSSIRSTAIDIIKTVNVTLVNFRIEFNYDIIKERIMRNVISDNYKLLASNPDIETISLAKEELDNFETLAIIDSDFDKQYGFLKNIYQEISSHKVKEKPRHLSIKKIDLYKKIFYFLRDNCPTPYFHENTKWLEWKALGDESIKKIDSIKWLGSKQEFLQLLVLMCDYYDIINSYNIGIVTRENISINGKKFGELLKDVAGAKNIEKNKLPFNKSRLFKLLDPKIKKWLDPTS